MIYRCKCGWEKRDHRNADTDVERVEWKPDDVKLEPTNAYGDIEFHGAGKTKRAKVLTNFYGTVITWNWLIIIYFSLGFATAFTLPSLPWASLEREMDSISFEKEYFVAYLSEWLDSTFSSVWRFFFTLDIIKERETWVWISKGLSYFPSCLINNGNLRKLMKNKRVEMED